MAQDSEFIHEIVLDGLRARLRPLHDLDGHLATILQVVREDDCTGRALSESATDAVLTEDACKSAGRQE